MSITVSAEFKAIWEEKQGKAIHQRLRYKRRYKLGTTYYTEAAWSVLDRPDFCGIGNIPQQADVNRNVIKTSVMTLKMPNENNQWIEHAASPSFWAADGMATNGYKATRTLWQVQEGYMLAAGTIEWISVFTGVQLRLPKITGSSEYAFIEVYSNAILLEKADAEEVSTEPGLENCIPATGDGTNKVFESTSVGVDHAKLFEINGVNLAQGSAWRVSNDNEIASAGNTGRLAITALTAPTAGHTVKTSVKKWLVNQLTETLEGLLADEAGIVTGDRSIAPVIFPGGLSGTKTIDTQADWEAGTVLTNIDTTASPGDIQAVAPITFTSTGGEQTYVVPANVTSLMVDAVGGSGRGTQSYGKGGRAQGTITVTPGETLYIYAGGAGSATGIGGFNGGGGAEAGAPGGGGGGASDVRRGGNALANRVIVAGGGGGGGGSPPSAFDTGGNGGGTTGSNGLDSSGGGGAGGTASAGGAKGTGSSVYSTNGALGLGGHGGGGGGGGGGGYYGGGGGNGPDDTAVYGAGGGGGSSLVPGGGSTTAGYNALNVPGYIIIHSVDDPAHTSAVLDMLSAPASWGTLDRTDATNGGSIAYATAASTDGVSFDAFVAISAGGIIQSALKRYLKVRSTLTLASGTFISPVVSKLIVNFTTSTIYVSLANHRGRTCMAQMEHYVKLADYELRFRGDGSMVIGPKAAGSYVVHLTQENGIIDVTDVDYGIPDRVIRAARVRYQGFVSVYGDTEAAASAETIADGDELGKAVLDEDLDQVLVANDLNLGDSRARVLYENNRRSATDPRPPVRLRLKIWDVPWLEVGDTVRVSYYDHPLLGVFQANDELLRADSPYFHMGAPGNVISAAKDWRVIYYNPNKDTGQAELLTEEVL